MRDKWSVGNIRAIGESGDHQSREEKGDIITVPPTKSQHPC